MDEGSETEEGKTLDLNITKSSERDHFSALHVFGLDLSKEYA